MKGLGALLIAAFFIWLLVEAGESSALNPVPNAPTQQIITNQNGHYDLGEVGCGAVGGPSC